MKKRRERRKSIICPYCGQGMVCMSRFESIFRQVKGFYVWYICPRRKEENGCGHSVLLGISTKTKSPQKVVSVVKSKKGNSKRKVKK